MGRVHVIGNATVDLIQRVPRLPHPGETLLASGLERCAGGKGLNQAIAAGRAGAKVELTAPIGCDADGLFLSEAVSTEEGLYAGWIRVGLPTDLSVIWVAESGENAIVSSAACARMLTAEQAHHACASLGPGDILLMQGNLTRDATCAAAEEAARRGATRILNTAPIDWDMGQVLPLFDIVIANAGEGEAMTDGAGDPLASLVARGVRTAIITLGSRGARIGTEDGYWLIMAPQVNVVDTSGAGDVFVGTLAALLARQVNLFDATSAAVKAASLSVTRHGTTPSFPSRAEMLVLFQSAGP